MSKDFCATVCKTVRAMLSDRCLSCPVLFCLSVCNVGVLWLNSWMDRDETWHGDRHPPGHIVLDGDPAAPNFQSMPIVAKWLD